MRKRFGCNKGKRVGCIEDNGQSAEIKGLALEEFMSRMWLWTRSENKWRILGSAGDNTVHWQASSGSIEKRELETLVQT